MYATHTPGMIPWGVANAQMGRNSIQTERAKAILRAITGSLDSPGGTCLVGPPPKVLGPGDTELPDMLPPGQRKKKLGADRFRLHGEGYELLNQAMGRVWYGKKYVTGQQWTADVPDPVLWKTILTGDPYPLKALIIQYHNPLGASPNSKKAYEALKGPNLDLVVVHELFMTPTAEMADYVLPASHWLERTGLHNYAGWGSMAIAGDKAVDPSFDRHSDYDLWRDLGWRLGQQDYWPKTLEGFWDEMLRPEGVSFSELLAQPDPWIAKEWRFQKHEEIDSETEEPRGFGTPTHKVEFASTILEKLGYDPLPSFEEPAESSTNQPELAKEYPLILITGGTVIECHHQGFRQTRFFREKYPDPEVHIHPETARDLGIQSGDWVWIETSRGKVRQKARLNDNIHPRVVQADRWWYPEEEGPDPSLHGFWKSNVNLLTDDDIEHLDPAYGTWAARGNLCRVRKVEGNRS
jgi:anaerobic selenocysteine-containing dehydrogenase